MTAVGKRRVKMAVVAIFAALLGLPGLQMATGLVPERPIAEYRVLAKPPEQLHLLPVSRFTRDGAAFEAWFDDHAGFRNTLVRLDTHLEYALFRTNDRVYVGRQGWLFEKTWYDGSLAASLPYMDSWWNPRFRKWLELRDWLARRGIRLVVVDIPLKHVIYPEYLPDGIPRIPNPTRYDRFRAFLDANGIDRLDVKSILLAEKARAQVYMKADLHWSIHGACPVAKALVEHLARLEFGRDDLWTYDFTYHPAPEGSSYAGSETRAMPLLYDSIEVRMLPVPDDMYFRPFLPLTPDNPFDRIYVNQPHGKPLLPETLALNDSFFENMERCGLGTHFTRMATGRTLGSNPNAGLGPVLKKITPQTRYFIMEFMEVNGPNVLPPDFVFPDRL